MILAIETVSPEKYRLQILAHLGSLVPNAIMELKDRDSNELKSCKLSKDNIDFLIGLFEDESSFSFYDDIEDTNSNYLVIYSNTGAALLRVRGNIFTYEGIQFILEIRERTAQTLLEGVFQRRRRKCQKK